MDVTKKFVIEKKRLTEIKLPNKPRNIVSVEKPNKKDVVRNQKSRFWCLIIFETRFHIIVFYLHFVVINAFVKFSFSHLYMDVIEVVSFFYVRNIKAIFLGSSSPNLPNNTWWYQLAISFFRSSVNEPDELFVSSKTTKFIWQLYNFCTCTILIFPTLRFFWVWLLPSCDFSFFLVGWNR